MVNYKEAVEYLKKLYHNSIGHGEILSLQLVPIWRKTGIWWTDEENKTIPLWRRILYYAMVIYSLAYFGASLVYFAIHWQDKELAYVLQDLSYNLICLASILGVVVFAVNREETTELLHLINSKNKQLIDNHVYAFENRGKSNHIFLFLLALWVMDNSSGALVAVKFIYEFVRTGDPYYKNHFFKTSPFSFWSYFHMIFEILEMEWFAAAYAAFVVLVSELHVRVSFFFDVIAEELRQLRNTENFIEEEEQRKLKRLSAEYSKLLWCVRNLNHTIRLFIIINVSLVISTIGVNIVVIIWVVPVDQLLQFIGLPICQLTFLAVFCFIGQHLRNASGTVRDAAYECNWSDAPKEFKRLLLNVLTQTLTEAIFEAPPFYDLNFVLFASFLKNVYSLIAILREAI